MGFGDTAPKNYTKWGELWFEKEEEKMYLLSLLTKKGLKEAKVDYNRNLIK